MNTAALHLSRQANMARPQSTTSAKADFWAFQESNGGSELVRDSHEGMQDRKPADVDPPRSGMRRWAAYVAFFTMVFASMAAAATVASSDLPLLMVSL